MSYALLLVGILTGHQGWVTQIALSPGMPDRLVSASRDKTLISWKLGYDGNNFGTPMNVLKGHSHFVSDVVLSASGQFAVSASWDKTLRLWDLKTGITTRQFIGHTRHVTSVDISPDNRMVASGSEDKTIKLWDNLGQCKFTIEGDDGHTGWVTSVKFSPDLRQNSLVSGGWDKMVKVWDLATAKLKFNLLGHNGIINSVAVSPDGSLCASGGTDRQTMVWDLNDGKHLHTLSSGDAVNAVVFSPIRNWLAAAAGPSIKIWDLESKTLLDESTVEGLGLAQEPYCISLAWSSDGGYLFAGYTDNKIRVFNVPPM